MELEQSTLANLLRAYAITNWDLILIGDGSGSSAVHPCGWSVVIIDRRTGVRTLLVGGQNMGSITLAEALPYLLALQHFDSNIRGTIHAADPGERQELFVHILTDSQHTARAGQGKHSRDKYGAIWAGLDHFGKLGYYLNWHWFESGRENPFLLHSFTDEMASVGRSRMMDIEQSIELYELLPPGNR